MEQKKRSARMSKNQKEYLITYLEKNNLLIEQKINPFDLPKYNTAWQELCSALNSLQGATKTVGQWKDALNEFKANTRKKARLIHVENTGTGGGPKTEKDLSPLEQRLLLLLSRIVITGLPGIPEGGVSHTEENITGMLNQVTEENVIYIIEVADPGPSQPPDGALTTVTIEQEEESGTKRQEMERPRQAKRRKFRKQDCAMDIIAKKT